jgi:putative endonuclease
VAQWYEAAGYEVLDRNWRCRDGELDLVVRRGTTLVFCEVKTRSGRTFGEPFEAVTRTKRSRIRRLAARWLRERNGRLISRPHDLRFDVASVLGPHLEILEDAF